MSVIPRRGDVFYISTANSTASIGDKPALVISSDDVNQDGTNICIIWIAAKPKQTSKFHVPIEVRPSIFGYVLCEHISNIACDRLSNYAGTVDSGTMQAVECGLRDLFGISTDVQKAEPETDNTASDEPARSNALEEKLNEVIGVKNALLDEVVALRHQIADTNPDIERIAEATIRFERNSFRAQATMYRRQYEELLAAVRQDITTSNSGNTLPDRKKTSG